MYTMVNMHMYIHMNEIHTIHIQYRDEIKKKKKENLRMLRRFYSRQRIGSDMIPLCFRAWR